MESLRVLVATERDFMVTRLAAQLKALGHRIIGVARDGSAAAETTWESRPDLVFLDQHLPPRDGITAARMILPRRIVPLILLIGYPAAGLVRQAQEAGVIAYLVWPTEARLLESAIEVARARFRELELVYEQVGNLPRALHTRQAVRRVKVLLMRRLGITEADAFAYVMRLSRTARTTLEETAEDLVATDELWFGTSDLSQSVDIILHALEHPKVFGPPQVA